MNIANKHSTMRLSMAFLIKKWIMSAKEKLVEVYAGTLWQAEVIKGLLDANSIPCAVLNETIGAVTSPYSPTSGDVLVVVDEKDKPRAIEVIEKNK